MFLSRVVLTDAGDGLAAAAILEFSGALILHILQGLHLPLLLKMHLGLLGIAGSQAASVTGALPPLLLSL